MIKTTIDIGTNTILMVIAEYNAADSSVKTLLDIQRVPRLGKGVDKNRNILPESIEKAIDILNEYSEISQEYNSETITATATSFIRDSANKNEFIGAVKEATGIEIEILPGSEEAKWTYIGGIYDKLDNNPGKITTIDIGGGSTEITIAEPVNNLKDLFNTKFSCRSLDVGSVRVNEKYLSSHPPSYQNIAEAEQFINEHLAKIDFDITGSSLVGVAGTVTTLAAIKLGLSSFEADKVDNTVITIDEIEHILSRLTPLSLEELYLLGDYMTGRADIVIPGILILKCFMRKFGFAKVKVSTKGLRYGVFLREVL
jgi:exopolyphosphatase/guanosine-5'-triphosphate,3'-diphosphate pyrophosphatase